MESPSTPEELARKAVEDLARETGARIRAIRGDRSQIEFAEQLGVGRTTLIRYESGERQPDVEFIVKLNLLFGTQPLWLFTGVEQGDDDKRAVSPTETPLSDRARLVAAISAVEEGLAETRRKLPPDKRAELILAAYDLMAEPEQSRNNVIRMVRAAA